MSLTGTTTELLEAIRDDARLAPDDPSATDTILLREATRVLHKTYVPAVRKCRSDYYLSTARIALEAGRSQYPIPRRATTSTVRRVRILNSAGETQAQLSQASIEDLDTSRSGAIPQVFAITDANLTVWPTPSAATYTLEIMFEYRPSALIAPDANRTALYTYVSATKTHVVLCPFATGLVVGDVIDLVAMNPPFPSPLLDATISAIAIGDRQLSTVDYMGLQEDLGYSATTAGLYVCAPGESPIPQIPLELHPCLATHTAAKFLRPIDPAGSAELQAAADQGMIAVLEAMTPRKQGIQQKMRPRTRNVMVGGSWARRGGTFGDVS